MKILHLVKNYYPHCGGMETAAKTLAEGMVKRGHKVTVLCLASPAKKSGDIINGVKVVRIADYNKIRLIPSKVSSYLRQQTHDIDIVHLHLPSFYMESGYFFSSRKQPLVVSCHNDLDIYAKKLPLIKPICLGILDCASAIVVATRYPIEYSQILSSFRVKCKIIPYGIDLKDFERTKEVASFENKLIRRYGKYILFVGRFWKYKGLQHLLKAMKEIDAHLVLVGNGVMEKKMKALSRSYGITDKTSFVNCIEDRRVLSSFYYGSQMLVLPSTEEAFGLVQLEAMACGKPTVVSRLDSGVSLVQEDNLTGLYCIPRSSKDIAQKINSLLFDDTKRKRMGIAARKRVKKYFLESKMLDAYEKVYKNL
jgi:glycosyltransferase involved in cell wall biosynthesis